MEDQVVRKTPAKDITELWQEMGNSFGFVSQSTDFLYKTEVENLIGGFSLNEQFVSSS